MGYKLTVYFHPRSDEGYDLSTTEEKTKRVGKAYDPRDDQALAREVIRQFSRRDVLVSSVEVVEFVEREVKVKPSSNGHVLIRGKKYSLEGTEIYEEGEEDPLPEDEVDEKAAPAAIPPPPKENAGKERKPLRREVFDPPLPIQLRLKDEFEKQGLSPGKAYDILEEGATKKTYIVRLDDGREVSINREYFDAIDTPVELWEDTVTPDIDEGVDLGFNGIADDSMPNLRG